jgi:transcriptional regulator with XRE-family HTH domain
MRTEGQVLLLKLANKLSEVRIARKCGVGQPTISLWISGKRKPLYENRKTLLEVFKIPMEAWDRREEDV